MFGLSGDVVATQGGSARGWRVGPSDGSAPSLRLSTDAQQWWQYGAGWADGSSGTGCAPGGAPVLTPSPSLAPMPGGSVCEALRLPAGVPTAEEAEVLALDLLAALGVEPESVVVEAVADERSATVAVNEPLPESVAWAEGVSNGRTWSFGWGADGVLQWGSGALAVAQPVGPYPLIGLDAAVARLREQPGGWYGAGLDMPTRVMVRATVPDGDAAVTSPGVPPPAGEVAAGGWAPESQPITVTLFDVRADLWWTGDAAGNFWLVPAYRFIGDDGGWYTVPAIADEFLIEATAPVASVPNVVSVPPTTLAPEGTDPALAQLVGLPVDEFAAAAARLGYATWVGYDDSGSRYGEPTPTSPYVTVYTTILDGVETTTLLAEVVDEVVVTVPPMSTPPALVAVAEVIEDVEHYPACANSSYVVGDTTWYPVVEWADPAIADTYRAITSVARAEPDGPRGFVPRVPAPGPGDDIGTLVVWVDGVARFTSHSGIVEWATTEPREYNWVC